MKFLAKILLPVLLLTAIMHPVQAEAKKSSYKRVAAKKAVTPQPNPRYAAFLVDGDTGKILFQENADKLRYPASLTKMMTLYLLFEALENRKITLNSRMPVSQYAASRPATNLSLSEGDYLVVKDIILALIIRSANDASVVVAEKLGGTEENFARMMTAKAKQLGMKNTVFKNANGLHDPQQVTTAKEMALLGIALKKHYPEYYPYFARKSFSLNGKDYTGHNRVMENYPGADGLKTGFVNASGFNLVTTASRRGINLVGVVMGGLSHQSRDAQMVKLLDSGFEKAARQKGRSYAGYDENTPAGDNSVQAVNAAAEEASGDMDDEGATNNAATPEAAPTPLAQTYETNTYVRNMASPQAATKTQRYQSNMIVQPFNNPSKPMPAADFIPYPKAKPRQ